MTPSLNKTPTPPPTARAARVRQPSATLAATVSAALVALTLAACASSPNQPTGAIAVTLKPGDTGSCDTSPCQVSLVMPAGTGSFEVTGNEVRVGTFPAGQTVNLGGYWSSQKFAIVGAGVPPAYVYIPADN